MEKTITLSVNEYNDIVEMALFNEEEIYKAFNEYAEKLEGENIKLKNELFELRKGRKPMPELNRFEIDSTRREGGVLKFFGNFFHRFMRQFEKVKEYNKQDGNL